MDLYKEMLLKLLSRNDIEVVLPGLRVSAAEFIELESYRTLQKIKAVIEDDNLNDSECFRKIEAIVLLFEELGSGGGARHDFG